MKRIVLIVLSLICIGSIYDLIAIDSNFLTKRFFRKFHVIYTITPDRMERGAFKQLLVLPIPRTDEKHTIENLQIQAPLGIQKEIKTFPETGDSYLPIVTLGSLNKPIVIEYDAIIPIIHYNLPSSTEIEDYNKDSDLYKMYTIKEQNIEPNHPEIIKIADRIWNESKDTIDFAHKVYYYQQNLMKWKNTGRYNTITEIFANNGGDCGALTAIYISILRNKGIPSRKNVGGIIRDNDAWENHVWPEFYLEGFGWVEVDPSYFTSKPGYFAYSDSMRIHFQRMGTATVEHDDFKFQTGGIQTYSYYRKSVQANDGKTYDENSTSQSLPYKVTVNVKTIELPQDINDLNSVEYVKSITERLFDLITQKRKEKGILTKADPELNQALTELLLNEFSEIRPRSMSRDCRIGCTIEDKKERGGSSLSEYLDKHNLKFSKFYWQRVSRGLHLLDPSDGIIDILDKKLLLDSSMDVVGIGFAFDPIQKRYQIAISYGLKKD